MSIYRLLFLSLGHMTSDLYPGMLSPLLPLLLPRYGLSMAKAGVLVMVLQVFCNFSQPVAGIINDHIPMKVFLWLGIIISAIPFCFILQFQRLDMMMIALAVSGIGVGMFHPVGAVAASLTSSGNRSGISMAAFSSGGTVGFMIAPLIIVGIVEILGEQFMPLVLLPALFTTAYFMFNRTIVVSSNYDLSLKEWFSALLVSKRELFIVWLVSVFRAVVQVLISSFLPLLAIARGLSYAKSAYFLSASLLAGMCGMFVGGYLSDMHGRRKILAITQLAASPLLYVFLFTEGMVSTLFLLLGMAFLSASIPINIILAQRAAPKNTGVASSMVMGLSFGIGALAAPPFGILADHIGIEAAMKVISIIPVLGGISVFLLRKE